MGLLALDPFLNELHKMYERNKAKGSVWITMKRSSMQRRSKERKRLRKDGKPQAPPPSAPPESAYACLIRASDGKKHISATVGAAQYAKFQLSVAVIMKGNMDALKKREKVKVNKDATAASAVAGKEDVKK